MGKKRRIKELEKRVSDLENELKSRADQVTSTPLFIPTYYPMPITQDYYCQICRKKNCLETHIICADNSNGWVTSPSWMIG